CVTEFHTCFVGCHEWRWGAWAHDTNSCVKNPRPIKEAVDTATQDGKALTRRKRTTVTQVVRKKIASGPGLKRCKEIGQFSLIPTIGAPVTLLPSGAVAVRMPWAGGVAADAQQDTPGRPSAHPGAAAPPSGPVRPATPCRSPG